MGNFLDNPITEKKTEVGKANKLVYGFSCMQGWRAAMEDTHTIVETIPNSNEKWSFFGVFDGHGGDLAAHYSADHLFDIIHSYSNFSSNESLEQVSESIKNGYFQVDELIRKAGKGDDISGCTALVGLISEDHIIVGNSGDSRAVLAKNNGVIPMSFDHKPYHQAEKMRIEKAGGAVRNGRVNGDLAVSRALGDFTYKNKKELPPQEQQVSAEPDVKIEPLEGGEEFLVLACDGIWDVMKDDEVCSFVRSQMSNGEKNIGLIAEQLLDHCLHLGSRDNMSAIIVVFPGAQINVTDATQKQKYISSTKGITMKSNSVN